MVNLTAHTEQLLQILMLVSTLLLVPVAIVLLVVLFQVIFLLHSVNDLMHVVSDEVIPVLKNLRQVVDNLQTMGLQANNTVQGLGETVKQAGPLLAKGVHQAKANLIGLLSGLGRSFQKHS